MKTYDIFEQFNGYAFGANFNDVSWFIIVKEKEKNVFDLDGEEFDQLSKVFKQWLDNNKFPIINSYNIKECIEFFGFSLENNNQIKTNKNTEIFKKAKNYFIRNKQVILDELIKLETIQKEQRKFENNLPKEITIGKWQLEPSIVVKMSEGLPQAYIKILTEEDYGRGKSLNYILCESNSIMSEKAPARLNSWCNIINKLLKENANLFIDEMYFETEVDRMTANQVIIGVPFEQIGVPSLEKFMKKLGD